MDMSHISSDYNNVCSKPSHIKTKLKEYKMSILFKDKEGTDRSIPENDNKK